MLYWIMNKREVMETIKNSGQGTIFENRFLEKFTKTSPGLTLCTYVPVLLLLIYAGIYYHVISTVWAGTAIFFGAFISWTLFEYLMHRYIYHFVTDSPLVQKVHYTIHGVHHEYPRDKERLFMPPLPGLLIVTLLFGIFYLLMGAYVYIFLPGFLTGYLCYAFIHYSIHKTPVPAFLKSVYRHHALHHYKYPDKAFGVSSPFWDHVFGTMPPGD